VENNLMVLLRLAWKNLWRNRRRTVITLIAISFSLMLAQTHENLTYGFFTRMVDSGVRAGSGHMAIQHREYLGRRDEKLAFKTEGLLDQLTSFPEVSEVLPRIYLSALVQSSRESRGVLLLGIEGVAESRVNPYLRDLPVSSMLRPNEDGDAMVGERLADELGLTVGSKFVVTVQNRNGDLVNELFRIRGIVHTGIRKLDRSLVMVNLQRAAAMADMPGAVHELAVILRQASDQDVAFATISKFLGPHEDLQLATWEETMPNMANAMRLNNGIESFEILLLLIILTIGVINTLLMSVMERMREFGIILAMGGTPGWLCRLIFCEALILGVVGSIVGTLLGILATFYFIRFGLDLRPLLPETMEYGGVVYDPIVYAAWSVGAMVRLALYLMVLSLIASIYPAIKAARSSPVDAMRHY